MPSQSPAFTLWLTGLSGAGKSTLARALADALDSDGRAVEVLDGDEVRRAFGEDLGYAPADRARNMRRIGYVADLLSRNGVIVIVAAMSPYRAVRDEIRQAHHAPFVEVFVDCSMAELRRRDTKGLYARGAAGEIANVVGIDSAYEPPTAPDVHLRTDEVSVPDAVAQVRALLEARGLANVAS
jgi:adenylyl-sulfate kinase